MGWKFERRCEFTPGDGSAARVGQSNAQHGSNTQFSSRKFATRGSATSYLWLAEPVVSLPPPRALPLLVPRVGLAIVVRDFAAAHDVAVLAALLERRDRLEPARVRQVPEAQQRRTRARKNCASRVRRGGGGGGAGGACGGGAERRPHRRRAPSGPLRGARRRGARRAAKQGAPRRRRSSTSEIRATRKIE